MRHFVLLAGAAMTFASAPVYAQITSERPAPEQGGARLPIQNQGQAARGPSAVSDALFAAAAADGGLSEMTLSQLGVQRATDPELKQFSERMIQDHSRLNADLKALAARKGMALPEAPDYRSQFCAQNLAGLSGEEFDRCYAKAQLVAHMDAVALFEAEAKRGSDREMTALASKGLAHIKEHLNLIKPIAKKYMNENDGENARPSINGRVEPSSR